MSLLKKDLKAKERELDELIEKTKLALQNAPAGSLRVSKNGKNISYYCYKKEDKKKYPTGKYIKKDNLELVKLLAQKEYNVSQLKWAEDCCKKLKALNKCYIENADVVMYEKMSEIKKALVEPYSITTKEYIRKWETAPYISKKIMASDNYLITEKGEKVRSKSEKILADKFYTMGIPYKYECPITLKGYGTVYPDFTLLNVRERQEFYWEHLGMMDNLEYVQKAIMKIHTYEHNDLFPGRKLILSYESNNRLDINVVEALIEEYLM